MARIAFGDRDERGSLFNLSDRTLTITQQARLIVYLKKARFARS